MFAPSFWASRTNSARRDTVLNSFHGMMGLLSRPTLPKRKSVTHVSEHAPPMSPVHTTGRGDGPSPSPRLRGEGWGEGSSGADQHCWCPPSDSRHVEDIPLVIRCRDGELLAVGAPRDAV